MDDSKQRIVELRRKILTMEWDKGRNQLHLARIQKLEQFKTELAVLENPPVENPEPEKPIVEKVVIQ